MTRASVDPRGIDRERSFDFVQHRGEEPHLIHCAVAVVAARIGRVPGGLWWIDTLERAIGVQIEEALGISQRLELHERLLPAPLLVKPCSRIARGIGVASPYDGGTRTLTLRPPLSISRSAHAGEVRRVTSRGRAALFVRAALQLS